jgi:hypothetical protein
MIHSLTGYSAVMMIGVHAAMHLRWVLERWRGRPSAEKPGIGFGLWTGLRRSFLILGAAAALALGLVPLRHSGWGYRVLHPPPRPHPASADAPRAVAVRPRPAAARPPGTSRPLLRSVRFGLLHAIRDGLLIGVPAGGTLLVLVWTRRRGARRA